MTCLLDHNPMNNDNLHVALQCLKTITTVQKQRNIICDEDMLRDLLQLVPYASRLIGFELIMNLLRIYVALLEDGALQQRVKLSEKLRTDLSEAIARVWIAWHRQESIVQLARRALVAINPDYDTVEEVDDEATGPVTSSQTVDPTSRPSEATMDTIGPCETTSLSQDQEEWKEWKRGKIEEPKATKAGKRLESLDEKLDEHRLLLKEDVENQVNID